jgi:hypothetical protein
MCSASYKDVRGLEDERSEDVDRREDRDAYEARRTLAHELDSRKARPALQRARVGVVPSLAALERLESAPGGSTTGAID